MIDFTEYDRISDTLFYLSDKITLQFHVVLSSKDKNGGRRFFQFETEYSSKFIGTQTGRAIKRNMSFYFTFDNKNDFANGLICRAQDVYVLNHIIEKQVLPWFFDKRIFSIVKDGDKEKLVITGNFKPVIFSQSEVKYLTFTPMVYTYEDGTFKEGVRIYLNSQYEYADMDIDRFLGLYYLLSNTDMYAVATNLVNYVKMQPHGVNIYSMTGLGGGYVNNDWNEESNTNDKTTPTKGLGSSAFLNNAKKK